MIGETDKDGYKFVSGIEADGRIGVRVYVKAPEEMMRVFDFDRARSEGVYPKGFVDFGVQDMLEQIEMAYARVDPETAENKKRYLVDFKILFTTAKLDPIYIEEMSNQYCSRHCCIDKPWYRITSKIGPIKIGWRKRVIHIDWSESAVKASGPDLFPDEDVTVSDSFIHAWSYEKAVKYLTRLKEAYESISTDSE